MPHRFVGAKVAVRVTGNPLECCASSQRVAGHAVSGINAARRGFTTTPEHAPASHSFAERLEAAYRRAMAMQPSSGTRRVRTR